MLVKTARLALSAVAALWIVSGCQAPTERSSPPDETDSSGRHQQCGVADPTLASLAKTRDKAIGTAYRSTYADDDPCYREVALAEFDSLTTEIGTMMNTVQPSPGVFDFQEADAVADLAAQYHKDFQIHWLIWDPLDQP